MQRTSASTSSTSDRANLLVGAPNRRSRRQRAKVGVVAALIGTTVVMASPRPAGAAVSATTSGGTLTVSLTGDADVRIACSGGNAGVTDVATTAFTQASPALPCGSVTAVVVNGDAGNQIVDTRPLIVAPFTSNPTLGALLGDGADRIWETDRDDTIFTSGGNDDVVLFPGTVANTTINLGTGSSDDVSLTGTDSSDVLTITSTNDDATVTFTGGATSTWTIVDGENFGGSMGKGNDTVSVAGVTGASGLGYLSFGGDDGDDTFTSGVKSGYFSGGSGTNTFNLGTSLDSVNSGSNTDTISAAADSNTDYVDDFTSPRFGGRTLNGFGGSGTDRYTSRFARNDVTVRVRPGAGGTALATASLNRTGQQVLPAAMELFAAQLEGENGDIAHRSLADVVAVGQELDLTGNGTGSPRALYDVTIPTGAWAMSLVGDDVRIDPSAAGLGNISVPAASPYKVHGPWTDKAQGFAHRLHRDLLFQFPSDTVRDDLRDDLAGGSITRTQAARQIVGSTDYLGLDVDRTFVKYLRRPADSGGRAYWVNSIRNGKALWRFRAQLFGSNEYFNKAGGTNALYVAKAYEDVLGRKPDPSGQAYWTNKLNAGADRGSVALQFINSPEARRRLVDDQFLRFLDRLPTAGEQATWVAALPGATGEQDLIVFLASSGAYYDRS